jgi:hypothetical protein
MLGNEQFSTRIISLSSNWTQELTIYDNFDNRIPDWVQFVAVAVHSQQFNVTLIQSNYNKTQNNTIIGRNIGFVLIADKDNGNVFIYNNNSVEINVLIVIKYHKNNGIFSFIHI